MTEAEAGAAISDASTTCGVPGLTTAEAHRRLERDGPNVVAPPRPTPPAIRLLRRLREPLTLLLLVAAAASILIVKDVREGGAILAIVALNTIVGVVQEARADRAIDELHQLVAPTAHVHRDGVVARLPTAELVVGDVVDVTAGDRVPADLSLLEAVAMEVDESTLTGESLPVAKAALRSPTAGDVDAHAFAGTLVVRGRAIGEVTSTGAATRFGRVAAEMTEPPTPPLLRELQGLGRTLSMLAVGAGTLLVPVAWLRGDDKAPAVHAVVAGVALAVAAIPEGLPATVTGALALGAQRMARRGAIVRQLAAIETLGATSVLCTDKTGTLTTGKLAVTEVSVVANLDTDFWLAVRRCNDTLHGGHDPLDQALLDAAGAASSDPSGEVGVRVDEEPFDSATKLMATLHETPAGPRVSVKGAPEAVLARCADGLAHTDLSTWIEGRTDAGSRVVVVADAEARELRAPLRLLGAAAISDPLRASAAEAVAACRAAGLRVVLVTGDHPGTARAVASAVGLDADPVVTGGELAAMSDHERDVALAGAAVVARVDPSVKVDLVRVHRERGDVVAMTGDGVNDAPALRHADVGVAMVGGLGTDVARESADLVITDGDLGTIAAAVHEGRRIYRNLEAVVAYLVAGNLSEITVMLLGLVALPELALPLLPAQLLWINLVTDGAPALALGVDHSTATDPPERLGLLGSRTLVRLAGRAAILAAISVVAARVGGALGWSVRQQRTELFLALIVGHLILAYATRARRWTFERGALGNRVLLAAVGLSTVMAWSAVLVAPLRVWLGLAALPPAGWLVATFMAVATVATLDGARAVGRHLAGRQDLGP